MRVDSIADQLFYTAVFVESFSSRGRATASGFLISYPVLASPVPETQRIVLVTNKHVFEGANEVAFSLVRLGADGPIKGRTRVTVSNFDESSWVGHPDSGVDVAAMFFGAILTKMQSLGAPGFFRSFSPAQLATKEFAGELDSLETVTFVGFPSGLYDKKSFLPIARQGQTATPIFNDYNGLPAFLIDASVYPGSSGSPVVLLDRGSYHSRNGSLQVQSRFSLLGVIAQVHTREVDGVLQAASGVAKFQSPINLGIVFKASAIQEAVLALYEANGLNLLEVVAQIESPA